MPILRHLLSILLLPFTVTVIVPAALLRSDTGATLRWDGAGPAAAWLSRGAGKVMGERAIDLHHAETRLSELVRQAARGEDVILTEGGEPVAKIIPLRRSRGPREFGSARGLIHMSDDFDEPLEDFREYM